MGFIDFAFAAVFRNRLVPGLCLAALILGSVTPGRAAAITTNGVCDLGNCASPDVIAFGGSTSGNFNFIFVFANTDRYQITGNFSATNTSGPSITISGPSVTYLGNGLGTTSGADTLTIDIVQGFQSTLTSGNGAFESIDGFFAGPIAAGSSAAGQLFLGSDALPVMGPFPSPNPFSTSLNNLPFSGLGNPLLLDFRFTDVFASGSGVGASVTVNTPEPGPAGTLLAGLIALAAARAVKKTH